MRSSPVASRHCRNPYSMLSERARQLVLDDVRARSDGLHLRVPFSSRSGRGGRPGAAGAVEYPDLVVRKPELCKFRIHRRERLPDRRVEGVDGPVPLRDGVEDFPPTLSLPSPPRISPPVPVLDVHREVDERDGGVVLLLPLHHQRDGRLRRFKGEPFRLQRLDLVEDLRDPPRLHARRTRIPRIC